MKEAILIFTVAESQAYNFPITPVWAQGLGSEPNWELSCCLPQSGVVYAVEEGKYWGDNAVRQRGAGGDCTACPHHLPLPSVQGARDSGAAKGEMGWGSSPLPSSLLWWGGTN